MLHSLQYYACCYALLCLLHQQQRAASLTIIIDGATTNEWATQDEYMRMLEASNDLETALSQQQQQDQTEQDLEQQQPPPAPPLPFHSPGVSSSGGGSSAAAIRRLYERGSVPQRYCGKPLIEMLDLVCHGEFYGGPQIAEPIIKSKRASRLRALSSSSSQSTSSFQSPPEQPPFSASSASLSSASSLKQPPPIGVQSDTLELGDETNNYSAEQAGSRQSERNSRLQQIQMMLPAHLQAGGGGGSVQHSRQTTDNNNDGDTITINSNPLMTSKSRNRYNRMVLSRRIRGASEECCKRPCDMETLRTYCKLPAK